MTRERGQKGRGTILPAPPAQLILFLIKNQRGVGYTNTSQNRVKYKQGVNINTMSQIDIGKNCRILNGRKIFKKSKNIVTLPLSQNLYGE